jgi:hypothetical protein
MSMNERSRLHFCWRLALDAGPMGSDHWLLALTVGDTASRDRIEK